MTRAEFEAAVREVWPETKFAHAHYGGTRYPITYVWERGGETDRQHRVSVTHPDEQARYRMALAAVRASREDADWRERVAALVEKWRELAERCRPAVTCRCTDVCADELAAVLNDDSPDT